MKPALLARTLPFAAFMALLALRGHLPPIEGLDARWLYALNLGLVGGLLAFFWRQYGELARQNLPSLREAAASVSLGLLVFVLWIVLDAPWMQLGTPTAPFVPLQAGGGLAQ